MVIVKNVLIVFYAYLTFVTAKNFTYHSRKTGEVLSIPQWANKYKIGQLSGIGLFVVGLLLVMLINPGVAKAVEKDETDDEESFDTLSSLLDLVRWEESVYSYIISGFSAYSVLQGF